MIALIGAGNVATWVASKLADSKEFAIGQVYSRKLGHARALADRVGAEPIDDLRRLNPACDIFLFALRDDAYPDILREVPFKMPLALHTAGSVSQQIFKDYAETYGVVYPLQTFSKTMDNSAMKVPLCVESDHLGENRDKVMRLVAELSDQHCEMTEKQRSVAHLAAVFACNFSNALCGIAGELLQKEGFSLDLIMPLMEQTSAKLKTMSPAEAQTGPAARRDTVVMGQQIQALQNEQWQDIYRVISDYILSKNEE